MHTEVQQITEPLRGGKTTYCNLHYSFVYDNKSKISVIVTLGMFPLTDNGDAKPLRRPYLPATRVDEPAVARVTELLRGHLLFVCRWFLRVGE